MKGSYCLILNIKKDFVAKIGALGNMSFKKGKYIYVGSALNNIDARVKRHLRRDKKLHWHIDYLTINPFVSIEKVFYKPSDKKEECEIARIVSAYGAPIKNFGSTDCSCKSHLFKINDYSFLNNFMKVLI